LEAPYLERDLTDHHRYAATLLETVATETCKVRDAEREIQLVLHLESLLLIVGEHGIRQRQGVLRREHVLHVRVYYLAVDPHLGTLAGGDVQIRCAALDHLLEEETKVDGGCWCGGHSRSVRVWR